MSSFLRWSVLVALAKLDLLPPEDLKFLGLSSNGE